MTNIFNLTNTDDLPDGVKANIPMPTVKDKILELFDIKNDLNSSEIKVGLWRKFKLSLTNGCVSTHLTALKKRGSVVKKGLGRWAKK
jgi:hypothetical protein